MGLMKLIDKHKKSTKKSTSIKKQIYEELGSYIKVVSEGKPSYKDNNLQNKINKHYGFQVPLNYVHEAIEEIFRQESMKHIKD